MKYKTSTGKDKVFVHPFHVLHEGFMVSAPLYCWDSSKASRLIHHYILQSSLWVFCVQYLVNVAPGDPTLLVSHPQSRIGLILGAMCKVDDLLLWCLDISNYIISIVSSFTLNSS